MSQRALARQAGVAASVVAEIESGRRDPSVRQLDRLLAAAGLELTVERRLPEQPCRHLRGHLQRSLTARLDLACGGPGVPVGRASPVQWELAALTRSGEVVVSGPAAVGVWVPGVRAPSPLPCQITLRPSGPAPPAGTTVRWVALPGRPGAPAGAPGLPRAPVGSRGRPVAGLVAVPISTLCVVWVPPPAALALDPACAPHRLSLRAAARLLHDEAAEDRAGRRGPAHRDPEHATEADFVSVNRRLGGSGQAPVEDDRSWRLGGSVSRDEWLRRHGYHL